MTPHEFAHKYEKLIHIIIWIFPIIAGAVGVARGDFNPARAGSLCMFADHPYDCSSDPGTYGNCNRGQDSSFDALYILVIPFLLTFLVLIVNLMRLTVHVFLEERSLYNNNTAKRRMKKDQQPQDHNENEPSSLRKSCWEIFALLTCSCFLTQSIQEIIDDTARNAESQEVDAPLDTSHQSLAMQSLVQSSLYIFAFIFSYSIIVINFVMAAVGYQCPNEIFWWIASIFWPLGGLFNIFIYTRPKISVIRRNVPGASEELWITLLLVVIFSGGEVPCEIDFGVGCSEDEINYLRPKREDADELSSYLKMRNVSNEGILNDSIPFSGTLQLMAKTSPDLISHEESCEKEIRWFYTTIFEIDKSRSERENGTKIMRNNTLHHDADPKRLAMERLAAD